MKQLLTFIAPLFVLRVAGAAKCVTNSPDIWSCVVGWDCSDQSKVIVSKIDVNPKKTNVKWKIIKDEKTSRGPLTVDDQKKVLTPVGKGNSVGFVGLITGKNRIFEAIFYLSGKEVNIEPPFPDVKGYTVEIERSVKAKLSAFLESLAAPKKYFLKIESLRGEFAPTTACRVRAYYDK